MNLGQISDNDIDPSWTLGLGNKCVTRLQYEFILAEIFGATPRKRNSHCNVGICDIIRGAI